MRLLITTVISILVAFTSLAKSQVLKAPNFKLETQSGKTIELAQLKGKVVVVNFWATWCGPCRREIPGFIDVYNQYKGKGLEIVGVSLDQHGWDAVKPYLEKAKITYPIVIGDGGLAEGYGGIDAIPATFIIDKHGIIAKKHVGYLSKSDCEEIIKGLL